MNWKLEKKSVIDLFNNIYWTDTAIIFHLFLKIILHSCFWDRAILQTIVVFYREFVLKDISLYSKNEMSSLYILLLFKIFTMLEVLKLDKYLRQIQWLNYRVFTMITSNRMRKSWEGLDMYISFQRATIQKLTAILYFNLIIGS